MFRKLRLKISEEGAVNVGIMATATLTVIGSLCVMLYNNLKSTADVAQVQSNINTVDIGSLKTDVLDIKSSVEDIKSGMSNLSVKFDNLNTTFEERVGNGNFSYTIPNK